MNYILIKAFSSHMRRSVGRFVKLSMYRAPLRESYFIAYPKTLHLSGGLPLTSQLPSKAFHTMTWHTIYSPLYLTLCARYWRSSDDNITAIRCPCAEANSTLWNIRYPAYRLWILYHDTGSFTSIAFSFVSVYIPMCSLPHGTNMVQYIFAKFLNMMIW